MFVPPCRIFVGALSCAIPTWYESNMLADWGGNWAQVAPFWTIWESLEMSN